MKSYRNFIGIDIGKFNFFVAMYGRKSAREYENTPCGIDQFLKDFSKELPEALCVLEPTGGYELKLLMTLCDHNYIVHRAHTRHVKNFVRSLGNGAKTDNLDAHYLSLYGFERSETLSKFSLQSASASKMYELVQRRRDLKQMLVAEKNRFQSPRVESIKERILAHIHFLEEEMTDITNKIEELISQDE